MEQNPKKKEIIAQLRRGRKTWTELMQNVKMSSKTLYQNLIRLIDDGIVVKYGVVESRKIVDYYDLVKKKEPVIAVKVPRMFEKGDFFFSIRIKKRLGHRARPSSRIVF